MENLLSTFVQQTLTPEFLWVVVATTLTMEFAKRFIPERIANSKWYPLFVTVAAAGYLLLKTTITGGWKEFLAYFIFTIILVNFIYAYAGKYIIAGILALVKKYVGLKEEGQ